jgi:hypothetical protein
MDERITEYEGDRACYLMLLDCNFGDKQQQLVLKELKGMDDESNEYAYLAYSFLNSISSLNGGGIAFIFDERILYLKDEALTNMLDELDVYFANTEFMFNIGWIDSVQNELEDLIENHRDNLIQSYLDACSYCAYTVNKSELHDIFDEKFSKDEVDKVIVLNGLKNSDLFSD